MQKCPVERLVRKEVLNFQPYIPGKPIDELRRELGLRKKIIKLASNENSLGTSKKVISAIGRYLREIYRYPDGSSYLLRQALARKYKISPAEIIVGAGTDELIELIGKTFFSPTDEIIVSEHAFIRYKMAGELMGCKVISVPMKNFTHDLDQMLKAVTSKTKAIFIANPNNPTGTYNTKAEVEKFLHSLFITRCSVLTIFDEAYYEYNRIYDDYPETLDYFPKYPYLIILRTFSKIYGLAGLRVGYGIAPKDVISFMDRIRPPFNVNLLAQAAALVCLSDKKQVINSVSLVEREKKYLYNRLDKIGIRYIPSGANFILVDVSPYIGKEVYKKLLYKGLIVRPMEEYALPNHIRVTIGLREENSAFIKAMETIFSRKRQ